MKILKFGGSSVGNAENIEKVVGIVGRAVEKDTCILVLSAMQGTTDTLIEIAKRAEKGDDAFRSKIREIESKHQSTAKILLGENSQDGVFDFIENRINELRNICEGVYLLRELSMRTLAKTLAVDPMAIYHHIPNKASLLNNVYESVLTELFEPSEGFISWQENLKNLIRRFRTLALRHPRIAPALIASSHNISSMSNAIDLIYGFLLEAGLDAKTTLQASDTLFAFITGFILLEVNAEEPNPQTVSTLGHTQAMYSEIQNNPFSHSFEFGLQLVIAGIETEMVESLKKHKSGR